MFKFRHTFLRALFATGLFFAMGSSAALAVSIYQVDQSTATVGTAQAYEIEYTVDTTQQTWADADLLQIQLPDNFPVWSSLTFSVEYDQDVTNDATNETAITAGAGNGQYAVADRGMTIKWNVSGWGAVVNGASTVRVLITANAAPTYALASAPFTFSGNTVNVGDTNPGGSTTIVVSAADANGSITLADPTSGATQNTTLTLTISSDLANTDSITFTAPNHLDVASAAMASTTFTYGGAVGFACAAAGQVVECIADGSVTSGTGNIVLSGITSKYVAATDVSNLEVHRISGGAGGSNINADSSVAVTDSTIGTLASTNVEPAALIAATYSNVTVTFTTNYQIPASGTIVVTFPSGFDVSNVNGQAPTSCTRMTCANWTATVSGQNVTLTENGTGATTAGATAFTLADIMTPGTTGSTGTYTIFTTTGSANIDSDTGVTADTLSGKTSSTPTIGDPSGLTITDAEDGNGVTLTWTDPSGDDSEYVYIYRGIDPYPVNGTSIASVAIGEETYTDTDVEAGDVVTYQIRGYASGTYGDMTDEVTFTVGSGETVTTPTDTSDTSDTAGDDGDNSGDTSDTSDTADAGEETNTDYFSDISGHWAEDYIIAMADSDVVHGNPDGTFLPDGNLNRAEAAALLYRVLGLSDPSSPDSDPFDDVDMEAWYAGYVAELLSLRLVEGNPDGTYQPSEDINRAEFLQLAMNIYEYVIGDISDVTIGDMFNDVDAEAWYAQAVANAADMGFVEGYADGSFQPGGSITRAEATTILYRMFADSL